MPIDQLVLFVCAGWLLNLTPGPDVLCIVSHALRHGARAGVVAGLGVTAGCCVHIAAAALGLGVVLATSSWAFAALKWAGASYLFYVGIKLLLSRSPSRLLETAADGSAVAAPADLWRVFASGFWTNALNPKVALFFLAFVPQFIAPGTEHPTRTFVALGVLFNINAIPVNMGWAFAAAWMARHARSVQRSMLWLDRCAGALFIAFGLKLALTHHPAH